MRSVGDLVALIHARIDAAHAAACPTLSSFMQLRSCVREIAYDNRLCIRTSTRVVDALTGSERPPAMRKALVFLVLAAIASAIASAAAIDVAILPLTLALAAIFTLALHFLTLRFRIVPPDALTTFGAISQCVAGATVASYASRWTTSLRVRRFGVSNPNHAGNSRSEIAQRNEAKMTQGRRLTMVSGRQLCVRFHCDSTDPDQLRAPRTEFQPLPSALIITPRPSKTRSVLATARQLTHVGATDFGSNHL